MEMISRIDGVAIAIILFSAFLLSYSVLGWWRKRPRGYKEGGVVRMLTVQQNRDAVQAFLDLNHINGDANIRDGKVMLPTPETRRHPIIRMIRNAYGMTNESINADASPLYWMSRFPGVPAGHRLMGELSVGDLPEIADLLEKVGEPDAKTFMSFDKRELP